MLSDKLLVASIKQLISADDTQLLVSRYRVVARGEPRFQFPICSGSIPELLGSKNLKKRSRAQKKATMVKKSRKSPRQQGNCSGVFFLSRQRSAIYGGILLSTENDALGLLALLAP